MTSSLNCDTITNSFMNRCFFLWQLNGWKSCHEIFIFTISYQFDSQDVFIVHLIIFERVLYILYSHGMKPIAAICVSHNWFGCHRCGDCKWMWELLPLYSQRLWEFLYNFEKRFYFYLWVCLSYGCSAYGGQERVTEPLELKLQLPVLGLEPRSLEE